MMYFLFHWLIAAIGISIIIGGLVSIIRTFWMECTQDEFNPMEEDE